MTSASNQIENTLGASEIPAVPGHWLLGSVLEFKRAPHAFLQRIAGYGSGLVKFRLFHKPLIIITEL